MGSLTFDGVRFQIYSHDNAPPHVHGSYADAVAVIELDLVELACRVRDGSVRGKAKRTDLAKILARAIEHRVLLLELWEATHGTVQ